MKRIKGYEELTFKLYNAIDNGDLQFYTGLSFSPDTHKVNKTRNIYEFLENIKVVIYKTEESLSLFDEVLNGKIKAHISTKLLERNNSHTLIKVDSGIWTTLEMQQEKLNVWFNKSKEVLEDSQENNKIYEAKFYYDNPTRNNRIYCKALWENVLKSDSFKKGISTKSIFGKVLNCPEPNNLSPNLFFFVVIGCDLYDSEDCISVKFKILNNKNGSILEGFLNSGIQFNIVPVGDGRIIHVGKDIYVDPITYSFTRFDLIAN